MVSRRHLLLSVPAVLAWRSGSAVQTVDPAGALQWVSGNLPPFVWFGPNGPQGYGVELIQLMAARMGRSADITFYPWIRALRMLGEGEHFATFPVGRTPEREAHFRWLIKLGHVYYTFYVRAASPLNVQDIDILKQSHIGVLRGSVGMAQLQARGFRNLVETQDYKDLARHLATGLVDAIYGADSMVNGAMAEFAHRPDEFRTGLSLEDGDLYIATSLKLDDAEFERWQRAYRELQQDGTVSRLLKKYPFIH